MSTTHSCPRESDVLELVSIGQWPSRADAELREHVEHCEVCADLGAAAAAIVEWRDDNAAPVSVPDASVIWYRAQLHARIDAARQAGWPVRMAQAAGAVCFLAVAVAWWSAGTSWLSEWWSRLSGLQLPRPEFFRSVVVPESAPLFGVALIVLLAWMVLLPIAWYLADLADE